MHLVKHFHIRICTRIFIKFFFVHKSMPVAIMGVEGCLKGITTVVPGVWNNLSMFWVQRFFSRPMANIYLFNQWFEGS